MAALLGLRRVQVALGAVAFALVGAAPGCAEDPKTSPQERARTTVEVLLDACAEESPLVAMETLTAPAKARFVAAGSVVDGCHELLGEPVEQPADSGEAEVAGEAEVVDVSVDAGLGTARVSSPEASTELDLELGTSGWLITGAGR